jgi:hypothetical protein
MCIDYTALAQLLCVLIVAYIVSLHAVLIQYNTVGSYSSSYSNTNTYPTQLAMSWD